MPVKSHVKMIRFAYLQEMLELLVHLTETLAHRYQHWSLKCLRHLEYLQLDIEMFDSRMYFFKSLQGTETIPHFVHVSQSCNIIIDIEDTEITESMWIAFSGAACY